MLEAITQVANIMKTYTLLATGLFISIVITTNGTKLILNHVGASSHSYNHIKTWRSPTQHFLGTTIQVSNSDPTISLVPRPSLIPVFDCRFKSWNEFVKPFCLSLCVAVSYKKRVLHTASNQKLEPGKAWEWGYPQHPCKKPRREGVINFWTWTLRGYILSDVLGSPNT